MIFQCTGLHSFLKISATKPSAILADIICQTSLALSPSHLPLHELRDSATSKIICERKGNGIHVLPYPELLGTSVGPWSRMKHRVTPIYSGREIKITKLALPQTDTVVERFLSFCYLAAAIVKIDLARNRRSLLETTWYRTWSRFSRRVSHSHDAIRFALVLMRRACGGGRARAVIFGGHFEMQWSFSRLETLLTIESWFPRSCEDIQKRITNLQFERYYEKIVLVGILTGKAVNICHDWTSR